jgi:hypothetical protein
MPEPVLAVPGEKVVKALGRRVHRSEKVEQLRRQLMR